MTERICPDVGSEKCPCSLFTVGQCPVCKYDENKESNCNYCHWSGSCIYTLWHQRRWEEEHEKMVEEERLLPILKRINYDGGPLVLRIKAPKGFCQCCREPGSFVFARAPEKNQKYDMPVSVLTCNDREGYVDLAILPYGVKSMALASCREGILLRGPYRNGIVGIDNIKENADRTLAFLKGAAMFPMHNLISGPMGKKLRPAAGNMEIFVDRTKVGMTFIQDYFGEILGKKSNVTIRFCDFQKEIPFPIMGKGQSVNLLLFTSPYYAQTIEKHYGIKVVMPNSVNMCCGEGTCGACSYTDVHGVVHHPCKEGRH